jgi:hypothetical protein
MRLDIPKKWQWAAGGTAAFFILAFLTLRFGGQLAAPFLSSSAASADSQSITAVQSGDTTSHTSASDTSSSATRLGPFLVEGMNYTFEVQRDTGEAKSPQAARRVQVFDAKGQVAYDENLFLRSDSTSSESWIEFTPSVLEDATGRARGFSFSYNWFPSAPGSGAAFNIVGRRGDSLVVLTPTVIGYYGSVDTLPTGASPQSRRLLPGNRLVIESSNGWFNSLINLRVDFDCKPQSAACLRIDQPDSVAGLARFPVKLGARVNPDSIATVEMYSAPHSSTIDRIGIPPGQQAEILGGAGKVYFERTPSLFLSTDDQWLEIRINGKRGWITGDQSFRAVGLQQAG